MKLRMLFQAKSVQSSRKKLPTFIRHQLLYPQVTLMNFPFSGCQPAHYIRLPILLSRSSSPSLRRLNVHGSLLSMKPASVFLWPRVPRSLQVVMMLTSARDSRGRNLLAVALHRGAMDVVDTIVDIVQGYSVAPEQVINRTVVRVGCRAM